MDSIEIIDDDDARDPYAEGYDAWYEAPAGVSVVCPYGGALDGEAAALWHEGWEDAAAQAAEADDGY